MKLVQINPHTLIFDLITECWRDYKNIPYNEVLVELVESPCFINSHSIGSSNGISWQLGWHCRTCSKHLEGVRWVIVPSGVTQRLQDILYRLINSTQFDAQTHRELARDYLETT